MYIFGRSSKAKLETCHPALQAIVSKVMSWQVMDFSVIEGHRSLERQLQLYRSGMTHIDGIRKKGKHNYTPSEGVDLLPYPYSLNGVHVWDDRHRFTILAGLMFAAAAELTRTRLLVSEKLRWGGDWDRDGNYADQNFHDLPHFELF